MSFVREGLLFREVETTDLATLRQLRNEKDSWQGWRNPLPLMNLTQQMEWYKSLGPEKMAFIVCVMVADSERVTDDKVGMVRCTGLEEFTRCMYFTGCDVFPDARGKGYGTRMIKGLTDWAIRDLGAHRVVCEAMDSNPAAQKMILKAGYCEEGKKRSYIFRDGRWHDFLQYSALESEWL